MEEYGSFRWSKNVALQLDEIYQLIETLQKKCNELSLGSVEGQLTTLSSTVTGLQASVSSLSGDLTTQSGTLQTLSNGYSTMQATVSGLVTDVSSLGSNYSSLSSTVGTLSQSVTALGTSLTSLQSRVSQNETSITTLQTTASTHTSQISALQGDVEALQQSSGGDADLSSYKTLESFIIENETQNVGETVVVSTFSEIEARLTADTTYRLDEFKAKAGFPAKINFLFCAKAFASGEYGSARLDFYIDNVLVNSTTVTCEDDYEHVYEFEYKFNPTGVKQEIKMAMVHLSQTATNANVRICVQYVRMELKGRNCFFYERINSPVAFDCDGVNSYFVGTNPCFTFGNLSRYTKLWEVDSTTKATYNWNDGVGESCRLMNLQNGYLFRSKKLAVLHYYDTSASKMMKAPTFGFMGTKISDDTNSFTVGLPNFASNHSITVVQVYQQMGITSCEIASQIEINNQVPYHDEDSSLWRTSQNPNYTRYTMLYLLKDASSGNWYAQLSYNTNVFNNNKRATITMPTNVGTITDIYSCYDVFDEDNPYFCLMFTCNDDDEIYLHDFEVDTTKIGTPFSSNFLYSNQNQPFPLYIGKGINPFGYNKNGKLYIYFSYENRIYGRIFDYQQGTLTKPKYICDGQYYAEGVGGYHIRKQGAMSHVFKGDLPQ